MSNIVFKLRRFIPPPFRALMRKLYAHQFNFGFVPSDLTVLSPEVSISSSGKKWDTQFHGGFGGWIPTANHSHGYHGLLKQWWTAYGLGSSCLLISETSEVGASFQKLYPKTKIVTTDYYLDLVNEGNTDVVWNLYEQIPLDLLATRFSSIVCQATLEHLMDPVSVLRKFVVLLEKGGHLYLHTHTPLYPYHSCPRDYLRYFPDWFSDLGLIILNIELVELYSKGGHVFVVYRKLDIEVVPSV